jgi:integrase/recombinase XerD
MRTHVAPTLSRANVFRFVADILESGGTAATARARQVAVGRFSAWLTAEGEQDTDPLLGMKPPKPDTRVIEPLTDDQLRALLKACAGTDLRARRDEAIIRLMAECGVRAGECAALLLAASSPDLWLGERGKRFSYFGLHQSLAYRARLAGIEGFHPHLLRHRAASRWLTDSGRRLARGVEGGGQPLPSVRRLGRRTVSGRAGAAVATATTRLPPPLLPRWPGQPHAARPMNRSIRSWLPRFRSLRSWSGPSRPERQPVRS